MELKEGMYEEFKDIVGYEDYYEISNYGTVRSKERYSNCCYGKQRLLKEKIIVPTQDKNGYLRIMLSKNKNKKRFHIHELVARTFIDNYNKDKVVHHIDYNKQNNYVGNLYVCTRKEHITLHNKSYKLIKELIKNEMVKFDGGKYYVCHESMSYKVGD